MADDITPTLADVGAILRARTRSDATGAEIGTFDTTTRPTGVEVTDYVTHAEAEVRLRLPADIPTDLEPYVKRLVAIRAAMFVELSYDPDRTGDESAYARLKEMFDSGMAALMDAAADQGADAGSSRMFAVPLTTPTAAYSAELGLDAPDLLP